MPVIHVTATYKPNGNSRTRPFVAGDVSEALLMASVEWDIEENDPNFTWTTREAIDPEGSFERALVDAEIRARRNEMWR